MPPRLMIAGTHWNVGKMTVADALKYRNPDLYILPGHVLEVLTVEIVVLRSWGRA